MTGVTSNQLLWRCRRGARELDTLLQPYAAAKLASMTHSQKTTFDRLIQQQDSDLLDWFFSEKAPDDSELDQAIRDVLQFSEQS